MDRYVRVIVIVGYGLLAGEEPVCIATMGNVYPMPALRQRVGESLHANAVTAEAVRWIESRNHAKPQCAFQRLPPQTDFAP